MARRYKGRRRYRACRPGAVEFPAIPEPPDPDEPQPLRTRRRPSPADRPGQPRLPRAGCAGDPRRRLRPAGARAGSAGARASGAGTCRQPDPAGRRPSLRPFPGSTPRGADAVAVQCLQR
ncbi:hypothetical protein G6F31_021037 [Rhizopus arrhizus]|nr:hypothetical protein G6F31_021037 [Rhizopus arrhizus]